MITDVCDDIIILIMKMLQPHEVSALAMTCSQMFSNGKKIEKQMMKYIDVDVYAHIFRITYLSGDSLQWRRISNELIDIDSVLENLLLKGKFIRKFTIYETQMSDIYYSALHNLYLHSECRIDSVHIARCIIPFESVTSLGQFLETVGPRILTVEQVPAGEEKEFAIPIHRIIPFCEEKTHVIKLIWYGRLFLTYRQDWVVFKGNRSDFRNGLMEWHNPYFSPDRCFKYSSKNFRKLLQLQGEYVDQLGHNYYRNSSNQPFCVRLGSNHW